MKAFFQPEIDFRLNTYASLLGGSVGGWLVVFFLPAFWSCLNTFSQVSFLLPLCSLVLVFWLYSNQAPLPCVQLPLTALQCIGCGQWVLPAWGSLYQFLMLLKPVPSACAKGAGWGGSFWLQFAKAKWTGLWLIRALHKTLAWRKAERKQVDLDRA